MPRYLVEAYCTESAEGTARGERLTAAGAVVLSSIFVPSDQLSLHLFEAPSLEAAREVARAAAIAYARIVETVESEIGGVKE